MSYRPQKLLLTAVFLAVNAGCSGGGLFQSPQPELPPEYAMLPDSLVCVVDRATPLGLRELPVKVRDDELVVLSEGQIVSLETVHPVNLIAGYAGNEAWLTRGDPLPLNDNTFTRTGGERRVQASLLQRVGEYRGILLFSGADDAPPPDALYVPTAPGCVFQPFVRDDLLTP